MSGDILNCSVDEQVMSVVTKAARKRIGLVIVLDRDRKPVGMVLLGEENRQRSMMR
jgi:predicted transcriptional regulator